MRRLLFALAAFAFADSALAAAPGGVDVRDAWSRPAAAGAPAAGYMVITNHGDRPQTLARVETSAAREAAVHRTVTAGGMARMEASPPLVIPAGGSVRLEPGAAHIMFMGLKAPTSAGQTLPATLVFASGLKVPVKLAVSVRSPAPAAQEHMHMH